MHSPSTRKVRENGRQAREKILLTALVLFAEKGYAGTSVRDVAAEAEVNLAAIGYHFGDKAGLYRAALYEALATDDEWTPESFDLKTLSLHDALLRYMGTLLRPLGLGKAALLSVQLRVREYVEPSGVLECPTAERDQVYANLLAILTNHFGLDAPDDELHALAFSIFALISHVFNARDHLMEVRPILFDGADAVTHWQHRFTAYAEAMVAVEMKRRSVASGKAS